MLHLDVDDMNKVMELRADDPRGLHSTSALKARVLRCKLERKIAEISDENLRDILETMLYLSS